LKHAPNRNLYRNARSRNSKRSQQEVKNCDNNAALQQTSKSPSLCIGFYKQTESPPIQQGAESGQ